jgi:polyphenol oxidase
MITRRTSSTGVVFYASTLLDEIGIPHAFSTRMGGVSTFPFASLNLGNPNGCPQQDDLANIAENYRRLQSAIGCEKFQRCYVHQVHGDCVVNTDADFSVHLKADALVTADPQTVLSIRIADCAPILISDAKGHHVAAAHAGWRGAVAGVIQAAVKRLCEMSQVDASTFTAAIGPCIGFDAFEVGPEVLDEFGRVFGDEAPIRHVSNNKGHVDLSQACRLQLLRCGLNPDRVDVTDRCTYRDADEFFSHRRENGVTGRMAALIATSRG